MIFIGKCRHGLGSMKTLESKKSDLSILSKPRLLQLTQFSLNFHTDLHHRLPRQVQLPLEKISCDVK